MSVALSQGRVFLLFVISFGLCFKKVMFYVSQLPPGAHLGKSALHVLGHDACVHLHLSLFSYSIFDVQMEKRDV